MARDKWCQAQAYGLGSAVPCDGALIVHHRRTKGIGGSSDRSLNDPENLVVLCGGLTGSDGHHGEVHRNVGGVSYECGLLLKHHT